MEWIAETVVKTVVETIIQTSDHLLSLWRKIDQFAIYHGLVYKMLNLNHGNFLRTEHAPDSFSCKQ